MSAHPSLERCAKEIYLRPITENHLDSFIARVEYELDIEIDDRVKRHIIRASGGFPYFVHLVLIKCVEILLDEGRKRKFVELADYDRAIRMASEQAYRSHAVRLDQFIANPDGIEIKILAYMAVQRLNMVKTLDVLDEMKRQHAIEGDKIQKMVQDGINLLRSRNIIYLDRSERSIGFVGPIVKLFIAESSKVARRSVAASGGHQHSLFRTDLLK